MLSSDGAAFTVKKNPCGDSGTSEPATNPVVPHFPRPPDFRGHNSEKCGTGPELLNNNRWERMRSYIVMLRRPIAGGDVIWDTASNGRGICLPPPRERQGQRGILQSKKIKKIPAHSISLHRNAPRPPTGTGSARGGLYHLTSGNSTKPVFDKYL